MDTTHSLRTLIAWAGAAGALTTLIVLAAIWISSTFTMVGTITSMDRPGYGEVCLSSFSPRTGDLVTVYTTTGQVIGTSALGVGAPTWGYRCAYPFTVRNLPDDQSTYVVEIGNLGRIALNSQDAKKPRLTTPRGLATPSQYGG